MYGFDFKSAIKREDFDAMNAGLIQKAMDLVDQAIQKPSLNSNDIDDIILVGGSTRILKIRELLQNFFPGKDLINYIDPDEIVAYGAAVRCAILKGDLAVQDITLFDVNSLPLGVKTNNGDMSVIIGRNTQLPCEKIQTYVTVQDNQASVEIQVFEGEHMRVARNNRLGTFRLTDLPNGRTGTIKVIKVVVTFTINTDGVLDVSAVEKSTNHENKLTIRPTQRMATEKIELEASEEFELCAAETELTANEEENQNGKNVKKRKANEIEEIVHNQKKKKTLYECVEL